MKKPENTSRDILVDTRNSFQIIERGAADLINGIKTPEQDALSILSDAGDVIQRRAFQQFRLECPVIGDGKTVRFVTDLFQEIKRRRI